MVWVSAAQTNCRTTSTCGWPQKGGAQRLQVVCPARRERGGGANARTGTKKIRRRKRSRSFCKMQGVKRGHQRPGGPVISSLQMRGAKKSVRVLAPQKKKDRGGIRVSPSQHQARKGPSRGACATCGGRRPVVPSLSSAGGVWGVHVCVRVCVCMCVRVCAMIRVQKTSICRGGGETGGCQKR